MAVDPPFRIKNMMPGMIMGWAGSVATIPSGWHLCDGTVGTPDLRAKFIIGVQSDSVWPTPGAEGGNLTHLHAFTGDGHAHDLGEGNELTHDVPNGQHEHHTTTSVATGSTGDGSNVPPFYAFCWIMKL